MPIQNGQNANATDIINSIAHYAADAGSTDTYAISLPVSPGSYVTGAVFRFKANTINTGAATLNVNSLGAKTIKKSFNLDLADGDIKAGQFVEVIYDGTNFQLISPATAPSFASGITTHDISTTGAQTIAHGFTTTPRFVRITLTYASTDSNMVVATYVNGAASYVRVSNDGGTGTGSTSGNDGNLYSDIVSPINGVVTLGAPDATNINLSWGVVGSPTGTVNIMWEAFA